MSDKNLIKTTMFEYHFFQAQAQILMAIIVINL